MYFNSKLQQKKSLWLGAIFLLTLLGRGFVTDVHAQENIVNTYTSATTLLEPTQPSQVTERERELLKRLEIMEKRLSELETRLSSQNESKVSTPSNEPVSVASSTTSEKATEIDPEEKSVLNFFKGTTVNLMLDGYYGYNFNNPIGRANLLRANDVTSNSFSLNQAVLAFEQAPNVEAGNRFGVRLDLQYGQFTEAFQGSSSNETRPHVYRPILQAYGTYVVPVGKGLTVDFGKWVSALGPEGVFTKDQMNYSRSYLFNFLPYYHFGFRGSYDVNNHLNATYWLVNGTNQSEDFNGFKSQAIILNIKPTKSISWNVNYYRGIENRDPILDPSNPIIQSTPRGKLHIFDTYATWKVNDRLTMLGEFDYVVNRAETFSSPSHVIGGAAYSRYQFTPKLALTGRFEYLSDRGSLFSGKTQSLKEATITGEYKFGEGFLARMEWRRDWSNQNFFLTDIPNQLKKYQNTASLGLVWWIGRKQGSW